MDELGFGDLVAGQPALRITDDYGLLGAGASAARCVRCENGSEYIIKGPSLSPGNPLVAANELVAVRLARYLGLPVLDHDVAWMAGSLFFASRWIDRGTFYPAITRDLLNKCLNQDRLYLLGVFDAWICNTDRHHENLVVRKASRAAGGGDLLLLNDHSHSLARPGVTAGDLLPLSGSAASLYFRLDFLREALVDRRLFEDALVTVEGVRDEAITGIARSVPREILSATDATCYRDLLVTRRRLLRGLFAAEPALFPNLK